MVEANRAIGGLTFHENQDTRRPGHHARRRVLALRDGLWRVGVKGPMEPGGRGKSLRSRSRLSVEDAAQQKGLRSAAQGIRRRAVECEYLEDELMSLWDFDRIWESAIPMQAVVCFYVFALIIVAAILIRGDR